MAEQLGTLKRCPCTWLWPPQGWDRNLHIPTCRDYKKPKKEAKDVPSKP